MTMEPSDNRNRSTTIETKTIEFWEDDYGFRGTRARVGAFDIIAIDVNHPNHGYFAEFMVFWRSPHKADWQPIPVHRDSYGMQTAEDMLEEFPRFMPLFAGGQDYQWLLADLV